jgi:hypothetical protein
MGNKQGAKMTDSPQLKAFLDNLKANAKTKSDMTGVIISFEINCIDWDLTVFYSDFELGGLPVIEMECEIGVAVTGRVTVLTSLETAHEYVETLNRKRKRFAVVGQKLIIPVSESLRMCDVNSELARASVDSMGSC